MAIPANFFKVTSINNLMRFGVQIHARIARLHRSYCCYASPSVVRRIESPGKPKRHCGTRFGSAIEQLGMQFRMIQGEDGRRERSAGAIEFGRLDFDAPAAFNSDRVSVSRMRRLGQERAN